MTGTHKGKTRFVRFSSIKGVSDILGCVQGRLLAIEVKRPPNQPTPEQEGFLSQVNAAGGIGIWVDSVDDLEVVLGNRGIKF